MLLSSLFRVIFFSSIIACALPAMADKKPDKKDAKPMSAKIGKVPKIGVLNVHRIITVDPKILPQASDEWRSLYNKLQETLKPASKEIEELETRYKKKIAEIESLQKSGVSSKETLQKKYSEEIAPLEYQLQNQYQQRERFAQEELGKAQGVIGPKIEKVLKEVRKSQGWDMIIKGDALIGEPNEDFDITHDVLQALNKNYAVEKAEKEKADKGKPEAAKAA